MVFESMWLARDDMDDDVMESGKFLVVPCY